MLKQVIKITSEQYLMLFIIHLVVNAFMMMGSIINSNVFVAVVFGMLAIISGLGLFAAIDECREIPQEVKGYPQISKIIDDNKN